MRNRWESSRRPLFVRTIFVNGSRHAILSQEDPLCQSTTPLRKLSRPSSSQSYSSSQSSTTSSSNHGKRFKDDSEAEKPVKISKDLQGCIVKLRLSYEKQETKTLTREKSLPKPRKCPKLRKIETKIKRKRTEENKSCEFCEVPLDIPPLIETKNESFEEIKKTAYCYYENIVKDESENIPEQEYGCEDITREQENCDKKFVGSYPRPYIPPLFKNNDSSWNKGSTDVIFSNKEYYNPLSDRVLQWLDLASKKKPKPESDDEPVANDIERISHGKKYLKDAERAQILRSRSESKSKLSVKEESVPEKDVEEEVKTETDVDTVLSTNPEVKEYPKYTKELNEMNETIIKTKEKSEVNKLEKKAKKNKKKFVDVAEKRMFLVRQSKLQETSDEEEKQEQRVKMKRNAFSNRNSVFSRTIDQNKSRRDLLEKFKLKYMPPAQDIIDDTESETKSDRKSPSIVSQIITEKITNKIPWLKDYQPSTGSNRNMWSSDRATIKPQLHIFMPAISDDSNDESISECGSVIDGL